MSTGVGPGTMLGPYRIVRELGRGGVGAVYEAEDSRVGRRVALKVLLETGGEARFLVEARAAARLSHPNLVVVHDVGIAGGNAYLALELVEGRSLDALLKAGEVFDPSEAARIVRDLARALAYAHEQGVLHRDLKPANVMLTPAGVPRLTDFGLAKQIDSSQVLTRTGEMLGTPSYMAPEQADGLSHQADGRVDVYGLGATLYCLLTGRPPFKASSLPKLLTQILAAPARPPSELRPEVPAALDAVCMRCLEKEPGARYPDMHALAEALEASLEGEVSVGTRAGGPSSLPLLALALGAIGLLCGAAFLLRSAPSTPRSPERSKTVESAQSPPSPIPSAVPQLSAVPQPAKTVQPAPRARVWKLAAKSGPKARCLIQYGMTYDSSRRVVWLFGGWPGGRTGDLDDLWFWDGSAWSEVQKRGAWPSARANHVFVYDARRRRVVLWGGRQSASDRRAVWEFDGTVWERKPYGRTGPATRTHAAATYDSDRERVVIFGGQLAKTKKVCGDLWEWDGQAWRQRPRRKRLPTPRRCAGLTYDAIQRRLLLYGGDSGKQTKATLYQYDAGGWSRVLLRDEVEHPGRRTGHSFHFGNGRPLVFGGAHKAQQQTFGDTTFFEHSVWRSYQLAGPTRRAYQGVAYDSRRRRLLVFGGARWEGDWWKAKLRGDTWEIRLD